MKKYLLKFCFFIVFITINSFHAQRALYVDNFNSILGDKKKEKKLLDFSYENDITTLMLYDLHLIRKRMPIDHSNKAQVLANFISWAKRKYKIKKVIAIGENSEIFINYIHEFNQSRNLEIERFNAYNIEYNYWDIEKSRLGSYNCENYLRKAKVPCTQEGSFNYFMQTISVLKVLSEEANYKLDIEAYLDSFTKNQMSKLKKFDIKYRINACACYSNSCSKEIENELETLSNNGFNNKVSIVFSSDIFSMGGQFKYKPLNQIEDDFKKYAEKYENINFSEFTYYNYSSLSKAIAFEKFVRTGIRYDYKPE